jgi:phytoene dehydrogenase-like protein
MIPQVDPEQWAKPKVLISGAGVGGLTLALILEQVGYEYEVFERASKIKPLGMHTNAFLPPFSFFVGRVVLSLILLPLFSKC